MTTESTLRPHAPEAVNHTITGPQTIVAFLPGARIGREFSSMNVITGESPGANGRPYVPREILRAGVLLNEAMTRNNVTESAVAASVSVRGESPGKDFIIDVIKGRIPQPPLQNIINGAQVWIHPTDESMRELIEITKTREEENKWQWRLDHDNLSTGAKVRLIRLSYGMSKKDFVNKIGIGYRTLRQIEDGVEPTFFTLNFILKCNDFDKHFRRAGQRIRLDSYPRQSQSIEKFDQDSLKKNIEYLRVQRGYTRGELADKIDKSKPLIKKLEDGRSVLPDSLAAVLDGLEVPQKVKEYLMQKHAGEKQTLTPELIATLLDTFYFNHDAFATPAPPFNQKDQTSFNLIKHKRNFGSALSKLRKYVKLKQYDLSAPRYICDIERGIDVPQDYIVAKFILRMGYSMLDNTAFLLHQLASNGRVSYKRGNVNNFTKNRSADERS